MQHAARNIKLTFQGPNEPFGVSTAGGTRGSCLGSQSHVVLQQGKRRYECQLRVTPCFRPNFTEVRMSASLNDNKCAGNVLRMPGSSQHVQQLS